MNNEPDSLEAFCTDLLAQRKFEPLLWRCLSGPAANWQSVSKLMENQAMGTPPSTIDASCVYVTWLEDPEPHKSPGFVLVVFYETEITWTLSAAYNRDRILREG